MKNISTVKDHCFGCFACQNVCPTHSIELKENNEGFKYPIIKDTCNDCGRCIKSCPYLVNQFDNSIEPECYAFIADDYIRLKSSSGGVFSVLAEWFIKNNGYVAGAVYNNKEIIEVHHIISNSKNDIERMRNSKYLQSNIEFCYKNTREILKKGKKVLFTGTPCQIAGLKSFLKKDYENLFCVDLICHGVPSPKVFRKYINENIIKEQNSKWVDTNFRDKSDGMWSRLTTTTTTTTTTTKNSAKNDIFMQAFLSNLCLRKTCANCKFQTIPRQGDLTMGDFWGIWNYDEKLNDEKGTSVVLRNTKKGLFLIDILNNHFKIFRKIPIQYAIEGNPCLTSSSVPHKDRKLFFKKLDKTKLNENVELCLNDQVDYLIVNFWDSWNYGASLTAYAMQELVQSFGFTAKLLEDGERTAQEQSKNSFMLNFAEKFLNITNKVNIPQAAELSKKVKGVILGSDQILRLDYTTYNLDKYLLNWVATDTKKIALSASFGIFKDEFLACGHWQTKKEAMLHAIKSFDYLSCRENSGTEIYRDVFNLDSDWILDPVFLIDKSKFDNIIEYGNTLHSNKIISYILDDWGGYNKLYSYFYDNLNTEIFDISRKNYSVENWLKCIKECKILITDSFHGVCFALIFNKPFVCIRNIGRGNARFQSLIDYFNISKNFVYSADEITNGSFSFDLDYSLINNLIEKKRTEDLLKVESVLKNNYSNNPEAQVNKERNVEYINSLKVISPIVDEHNTKINKHYNLFKVLSYVIRSKCGLSHNKRHYYRNKLKNIFAN